ncbi:multidrug and toxin extrusion protein 1 [Oryzias latipes]|uniref:Multidrug and toxin extrusion protein n=1 Tax=Oryzias latipes TaxID=8090 RepID=H2LJ27_ORYLA|nr:multidrug and toxin extrusion protein 1 [Oryzias latipes]
MEGSSDRLFCCRWVRHSVPEAHREELYHILRMTGPLLLSRILNYLLPFVVTMFCGRLGNEVMAGYGLASATINVTTAATGYGLGLACDTLVSQTFGGKNLLRVGVILQRSIIILLLFCLPCWGLLINAHAILLCLGQDPEVARIAQLYITAFLPAVPAMFLHNLQVSYLQNQGIILPQMYTATLGNVANVVTNYILIYWLDLGVGGSAAANTLSQIYICVFLFLYIWWRKIHVKTWGGWSVESLQEWGSYMKLAVPSTLMKCFEWWVYEFGGFFAGMMSEDELAAQHAVIMVSFITYMFPFGIQAAACARVGNALGAGDNTGALLTSRVALTLAGSICVVEGLVLGSTKTVIGFIFTADERIIHLVSQLMTAYCFLQFFDGLVCVCTGIFLGAGKQKIPAVANFIGYYCLGLSLSITLMFAAKLRILGFWVGLLVCVIFQSTFYIVVIFRLNWEKIADEAVKRAQITTCMTLNAADQSDMEGIAVYDRRSMDVYLPVGTDCHNGNTETDGEHEVQQQKGKHLSASQLILRRGLTAFAALALLAVGLSVHFLVALPKDISSKRNRTMDWFNTTDQIFPTAMDHNKRPK